MKKLLFLTAVMSMFAFASCGDESGPGTGPGPGGDETILSVSNPNPASVPLKGGKSTFAITCNTDWKITATGDWLTFDKTEGSNGATIEATAVENTGQQRTSTITVKAAEITKSVMLTQLGVEAPFITLTTPAVAEADGGQVTFGVTSNIEWKVVEPEEEWVSITPLTGEGKQTITVTVDPNEGDRRYSTIVVTGVDEGSDLNREAIINQKGRPRPVTIDDLVGNFDVMEVLIDVQTNDRIEMDTDILTISKISDTELLIDNLFASYMYVDPDGELDDDQTDDVPYEGFSLRATFDAALQVITIPAQKIEPNMYYDQTDILETWFVGMADDFTDMSYRNTYVEAAIINEGDGIWMRLRTTFDDNEDLTSYLIGPVKIDTGLYDGALFLMWNTAWFKMYDMEETALAPVRKPADHFVPTYNFTSSIASPVRIRK